MLKTLIDKTKDLFLHISASCTEVGLLLTLGMLYSAWVWLALSGSMQSPLAAV